MTESDLLSRARDVIADLDYTLATGLDFALQPGLAIDKAVTVRYAGTTPTGGMNFSEEARGSLQIAVARLTKNDYATTQQQLTDDARDILSAIVRDGAITSGDYAVEDGGRTFTVEAPKGANVLIGRLTLPVNFEAAL